MHEVRISQASEELHSKVFCARPAHESKGDYTPSREKERYIEIIRFEVDQSLAVAYPLLSISSNIASAKSLGLSCGIK